MHKKIKLAPSERKQAKGCPSFTHNENDLWHDLCDRTRRDYNRVMPVSSSFIVTEEYRRNYAEVFGHE